MDVPEGFLKRHPFPGPGLAVRVLGDVTEGNALDILREVYDDLLDLCDRNLDSPLVLNSEDYFSRLMRFSFNQSRMLGFMIQFGKLLQFSCQ